MIIANKTALVTKGIKKYEIKSLGQEEADAGQFPEYNPAYDMSYSPPPPPGEDIQFIGVQAPDYSPPYVEQAPDYSPADQGPEYQPSEEEIAANRQYYENVVAQQEQVPDVIYGAPSVEPWLPVDNAGAAAVQASVDRTVQAPKQIQVQPTVSGGFVDGILKNFNSLISAATNVGAQIGTVKLLQDTGLMAKLPSTTTTPTYLSPTIASATPIGFSPTGIPIYRNAVGDMVNSAGAKVDASGVPVSKGILSFLPTGLSDLMPFLLMGAAGFSVIYFMKKKSAGGISVPPASSINSLDARYEQRKQADEKRKQDEQTRADEKRKQDELKQKLELKPALTPMGYRHV
jgi:hypothetical protein